MKGNQASLIMSKIADEYNFIVDEQSSFMRIDKLLCLRLCDFSRNKIVSLIDDGRVLVDGKPITKNYKVKQGDSVSVFIPQIREYEAVAENIPIDIVYEDDDIVVVNKQKGMVVHPAHGNLNGTLVNALLYHCKGSLSGINGVMRPGIVHRIDKDTSGLLVVAKNDNSHNALAEQFKNHTCQREYQTIVFGNVKDDIGMVNRPIGRHKTERKMMSCNVENGKNAITHYSVIARYNGFTHLSCKLETGRTHQIRVHMSSLGHFVIGDAVYGHKVGKINLDFEGQCLHAKNLGFVHPSTKEFIFFDTELPEYFTSTLKKLNSIT